MTTRGSLKVALALGWDGTRLPEARLPAAARKFLGSAKELAPGELAARRDEIAELRICWVPRLTGGAATLADSFIPMAGRRVPFRAVRKVRLGDCLGVVYRPARAAKRARKS